MGVSDPRLDKLAAIRAKISAALENILVDQTALDEFSDLSRQSLKNDIDARKWYAIGLFALGCAWVFVITVILLLQGFGSFWWGLMPFSLDTNVLLAAIGATTVNVLGLLYVVANYLFPKH